MGNFYIKRAIPNDNASDINSNAAAATDGAIIRTNNQIGIYKRTTSSIYNQNNTLNATNNSFVTTYTDTSEPLRDNIGNKLINSEIKSIFNKFFTNNSGDTHNTSNTSGSNAWDTDYNLNAFAYMRANKGIFGELGANNLVK